MTFQKEADFEEALIKVLADKGWEKEVIKNPTEQDLIRNWAKILFDNNRGIDRLNNYPLTDGEMQQIIEQITELRTPLKLNGFINGKTVSIKRDNPDDKLHFGTEISLKIYDRREIAAGQSRYQIVQQPVFPSKSKILLDGVEVFITAEALTSVFWNVTQEEWISAAKAGTDTLSEDHIFHLVFGYTMLTQVHLCRFNTCKVDHFICVVLQVFKPIQGYPVDVPANNDRIG